MTGDFMNQAFAMNKVIFSNPLERLQAMRWPSVCWLLLMLEVMCGPQRAVGQQVSTFTQFGGGTFSWGDANNWSGGVPNGSLAWAEVMGNFNGTTQLNLDGDVLLQKLVLGNTSLSNTIFIGPGTGGQLIFWGETGGASLVKQGAVRDIIFAPVRFQNRNEIRVETGELRLSGEVLVWGGFENLIERSGDGTLFIDANFSLLGPGVVENPGVGMRVLEGVTILGGFSNSIQNGVRVEGGSLTFGTTLGVARTTTFLGADATLAVVGGTVNVGMIPVVGQTLPTMNLTIPMDQISMTGGTLNLRHGAGLGTTLLQPGLTNTLTLQGGVTTFATETGGAGGAVVIPDGARLAMSGDATLNFTSAGQTNHTFASMNVTSRQTELRSQTGSGTLTIGGDGVDDVFDGQLNFALSNSASRLIKIGPETFTIGGNRDNPASRLEVREGVVVLAKESSGVVRAIGSSLIIGNEVPTAGEKVVRLGGSFVGEGAAVPANLNDQIARAAVVTIHADGVLDLNGFTEGMDYLQGTGLVTNRAAGTSATLILGEANFAFANRTFDGAIQDGGGQIGLIKTGDFTLSLTSGGLSYLGDTVVGRGTLQLLNAGALTGTQAVRVERGATLLLNNSAQTVQNRINDTADVRLDRGTLILRGSSTTNQTIIERMGTLNLSSFNIVRTDTSGNGGSGFISGSSLTMQFAGYNRLPGGQVAFTEQSNTAPAGFDSGSPASATSRIILDAMPTSFMVGGGSTNFDVNTSILLGAFGGVRSNASTEFMTVQQVGPSFYVRPLRAGEMNTIFTGQTVNNSNLPGSVATSWDDVVMLNGGTLRVNANTAFNAVRFNGTTTVIIAEDRKWILGGMAANANLNTPAFDGSGMLAFATGAVNTFGGTISFGSREAIMRVSGSIHAFRSQIEGTGGLSKSGGTRLDLMGANTYSGRTWLSEGELRAFTDDGFGAVGVGNEVINQIATLSLQSGINIGDGSLAGSKDLYLVGAGAVLSSIDQNNVWGGAIRVNPSNSGGQSGQNVTLRATGNSILTVKGMVTGAAANTELNLHEVNATQNFTGSGNGIFIENNVGGTGGSIVFLKGGVADREGQAAAGTGELPAPGVPARAAEHEKLNLFVRGFTGQSSPTNSDFVVSISDATKVNGRIDHRSGTLLIDTDYGTGGRGDYVWGALIRLSDGGNVDRAGIMAGLLMTQGDTIFRGNDIQIGVNDGNHSSNSMALIGGLNRSGRVIIGSDVGTLEMNPIAWSSQLSLASIATAGSGVTTLALPAASVRVGYGIAGPGIVPGTVITAVSNNVVTLSQPTIAAAATGTSYTVGYFSAGSNVTATTTSSQTIPMASTTLTVSNATGFAVGRGISGPGIPASTTIVGIAGNELTLSHPTTAVAVAGSSYSAYDLALSHTITLPDAVGLRAGMGLSGTGIRAGTTITAINGNVLTLSAPLTNAMPLGTSLEFPLARVLYHTLNANGGASGFNAAGSNRVRVFSANGLVPGTTVFGQGVATGTTLTGIQFISPGVWELTLSQNLIPVIGVSNNSVAQNVALTVQKASNFVETRLFAAPGGTVDFRMRVRDDEGFSLHNEVGALSKVGRGTVELSGSQAGASDYDGGLNLFGGTLVFDYKPMREVGGVASELARNDSRINGGNVNSPYQLTLAGGRLILRDSAEADVVENIRGTLTLRAGASQIVGEAGEGSLLRLNLGYDNPHLASSSAPYWRAPDRFAGGTLNLEYGNLFDPNVTGAGAARVFYSQNAPVGAGVELGLGKVIPYATIKIQHSELGPVVDFTSFHGVPQGNGQQETMFADSSGILGVDLFAPGLSASGNRLANWNAVTNPSSAGQHLRGYLSDDDLGQSRDEGWVGTLQSNAEGNEFRGVRVLRFVSTQAENTLNLGTTRLVLGMAHPSDGMLANSGVMDGGAILVSNLVSKEGARNQVIRGGSLTSVTPSAYFSQSVMVGPYSRQERALATSTDLILHNHNELGVLTIESSIVDAAGQPLNLVLSGPGTTKLQPTGVNLFSGAVYLNGGTLWVNTAAALGSSPTAMMYFNGGRLEIADGAAANRESQGIQMAFGASRPFVIGGNGAEIRTTAPGTVLTVAGVVRAEDNILPLNLAENQYQENMGVGDLMKTGAGRLILSNGRAVGEQDWNAFFGVAEVLGGTLQVNINAANSGVLGSHYSFLDGTRIEAGGRLDLEISGETFGTAEWFELLGGTLGTTGLHVDGVLDGMIRIAEDSVIDVTQGTLRLNVNAGTMDGAGKLIKTGQGMLMFYENSLFSGEIEILAGSILGRSQGLPLGEGTGIVLGDEQLGAIGTAGLFLGSRTTGGVFRTRYEVPQDIMVRGGLQSEQTKVLGAINTAGFGVQNDLYLFSGDIDLGDDLVLSYSDEAANQHLDGTSSADSLRGGSRIIALRGALMGAGNLRTEVNQVGGTIDGVDPNQLITFELGGNNNGWTGEVRVGNPSLDSDRQHILRVTHAEGLGLANAVTLDYNSTLQVGGHLLRIGNLDIQRPQGSAVTNGVYVENAANGVGTLVVNQTVDSDWNAIFRDGVTPGIYGAFDAVIRNNVLNLVKTGPARVTLTQANSYSGFTQVGTLGGPSGGTLRLGTGGTISPNSALTVFGGVFELDGEDQTLNQIVTLGGGAAGTQAMIDTGARRLNLGLGANVVFDATNDSAGGVIRGNVNLGTGTRTFNVADSIGAAMDLEVSAVLSGSAGLIKTGAGSMYLSGANTYGGLTTVSMGQLYLMGPAASGTGSVVVAPGAVFGGIGTIAGDVTLSSGSLLNPAKLEVGSPLISSGVELLTLHQTLTLSDHALVEFYLGQTGFSKLSANLIGAAATVRFRVVLEDGYIPSQGSAFDLLDWVGTAPSSVTNFASLLELPAGTSWVTTDFSSGGVLRVAGTPAPASFLSQPMSLTVDPGQPAAFVVSLTGAEPLICQWMKDGVDILGATGRSYQIPSAIESDEGEYQVRVTNGVNTVTSEVAVLTVNDGPLIVKHPEGGEFVPGLVAVLEVIAEGATGFEWRRNNVPVLIGVVNDTVAQGARSRLTIAPITEANEGVYTVVVSNSAGSIVSAEAVVTVLDPVVITRQPSSQRVPFGVAVRLEVEAIGHAPLSYQWRRGGAVVGTNSPTLDLTAGPSTWSEYTVTVSNSFSSQVSDIALIEEEAANVVIVEQPVPQIVAVGSSVNLTCQATGGLPLRYQWRRNGRNIPGATQPTLVLNAVKLSAAGSYSCLVSNRLPTGRSGALSDVVEVAVVNTSASRRVVSVGSRVTLQFESAGNLAFQWFFEEENSGQNAQPIIGQTGRTLLIPNVTLGRTGIYYCRATGIGGALNGGLIELVAFDSPPAFAISSGTELEPTVVSEDYRYEVPMDPDPAKRATKFVAKGLPQGLVIDADGVISGRATVTKFPESFRVSITASNARGSVSIENLELLVNPLAGGWVGTFTGWVSRQDELNQGLGGRLDLRTTGKGGVSGRLVLGSRAHRFRGVLNSDVDNEEVAECMIEIRRSKQPPLQLAFALNAATQLLTGTVQMVDGSEADIEGWRNKWPRPVRGAAPPASAVGGYYTAGLQIPSAGVLSNPEWPQGTGFASFTVNPRTARLNMMGRLADGTAFAASTFVGPSGQILVYRTLYPANARGSLLGALRIEEMAENKDNNVAGSLSWWRPATPSANARVYRAGFGPVDLESAGGRYDPPEPGQLVMGINPLSVPVNARLSFSEANVETAEPLPNEVQMQVLANHRVLMDAVNPRRVTLKIVPRTGLLSGRFVLSADHPDLVNGGRPAQITRRVNFSGAIVRNEGEEEGLGYFLLPQLPSSAAEASERTVLLSGQIQFEKLP
jgi:autotransporter-associated beta strand protein